jgi:hypothetical protein
LTSQVAAAEVEVVCEEVVVVVVVVVVDVDVVDVDVDVVVVDERDVVALQGPAWTPQAASAAKAVKVLTRSILKGV